MTSGTDRDRSAICDLVARYADAVNARDESSWAATWAPDGIWQLGERRFEGIGQILDVWRPAMAGYEGVIQLISHGTVTFEARGTEGIEEIEGVEGAAGRWTLTELGTKDGVGSLVVGCYRDRYTRAEGVWRFAQRVFSVTYRAPAPPGEFFAFPAPVHPLP